MKNGYFGEVKKEIERTLDWMKEEVEKLNPKEINSFFEELLESSPRKIFITGKGRSGKVAECFAMRLAHLGYNTRVLGETTAPPVEKDDLFMVISGGGEHQIEEVRVAREIGAKIIAITSQPNSTLAKLADKKLIIPGRSKKDSFSSSYEERRMRGIPVLPLGTAFEDFALIVLDSVIGVLAALQHKTEEDLEKRHARPE